MEEKQGLVGHLDFVGGQEGQFQSGSHFLRGSHPQLHPSVSLFADDRVEEVIGQKKDLRSP